MKLIFFGILGVLLPFDTYAASGSLDGASLSLLWAVPFAGVLLSIALFPLLFHKFWENHYGKIILGWSAIFLGPLLYEFGFSSAHKEVLDTLVHHYLPFCVLLMALFAITGGVFLDARWKGTPESNFIILFCGTLCASFIGTTGASMLLIRPILNANKWRKYSLHTRVFFIFLVANIGGCLTPLGDPPLFLGFLEGVPFFWPLVNMLRPLLFTAFPLLIVFYVLDRFFYKKEPDMAHMPTKREKLVFRGKINFFLLGGVLLTVILCGKWKSGINIHLFSTAVSFENMLRDLLLVILTVLSFILTPREFREKNHFSWDPLLEVAKIFFGIFITVIPVIAMLKAGQNGPLSSFVNLVQNEGAPVNYMYFWLTGLFSSFLDNAPTYFVFFHMAGGDPLSLTTTFKDTLLAISAGSVFMGAMTYIGNAPNFMVKAIAESYKQPMPSFFGYMIWSLLLLVPIFGLLTWALFV